MNPPAIGALIIAPFIIWKTARTLLAYRGDTSPATREYSLRYFTADDIETGKRCSRPYYLPGLIGCIIGFGLLYALVFLRLSRVLESAAIRAGGGLIVHTGAYVLMFAAIRTIVSAPLVYYSGYVLGRRLGRLKQTLGQWLVFNLKGAAVALIFTWALFLMFQLLVRAYPRGWWALTGAALAAVTILIVYLQPVLLAPIFYKFTRLEEGPLRARLLELCRKAGIEAREVFVQHESSVSTQTNAYFAGLGKTKRIVLYDNLLNSHPPDEVAAVVAHEAGHWKRRHLLMGLGVSAVMGFAGAYLLYRLFQVEAAEWLFGAALDELAALPVLVLLGSLAGALLQPVESAASRALERQADRSALELTGDADAFIRVQVRLVRDNKADLLPHPLLVRLYASHPTALQRIDFAEKARK
ncbi:MAG TPA: M48 family metallopeptidase [Planctomycetota bacterium]|nr:M48 family metallopeptidase [Planctomycetota bacterium]